jgi:hypothetical protein
MCSAITAFYITSKPEDEELGRNIPPSIVSKVDIKN